VLPVEVHVQKDTDPRGKDNSDWPPSSGPEKDEPWDPVMGKRRRKKKEKGGTVYRGSDVPVCVSDVASDSASGARKVRKDLSFSAVTRKTRDVEVSGKDPRVRPKSGARTTVPPKRTVRAGTRKRSSAVVMIRCDEGGPSYAEVMGEARTSVQLEALGITDTRVRRA